MASLCVEAQVRGVRVCAGEAWRAHALCVLRVYSVGRTRVIPTCTPTSCLQMGLFDVAVRRVENSSEVTDGESGEEGRRTPKGRRSVQAPWA